MVFRITQEELAAADAYEVAECKRVAVRACVGDGCVRVCGCARLGATSSALYRTEKLFSRR